MIQCKYSVNAARKLREQKNTVLMREWWKTNWYFVWPVMRKGLNLKIDKVKERLIPIKEEGLLKQLRGDLWKSAFHRFATMSIAGKGVWMTNCLKKQVKAQEYRSYISFGRSKKHHIVASNKLNQGMRNMRFSVNVQRMWGQSRQSTKCRSCFLPQNCIVSAMF